MRHGLSCQTLGLGGAAGGTSGRPSTPYAAASCQRPHRSPKTTQLLARATSEERRNLQEPFEKRTGTQPLGAAGCPLWSRIRISSQESRRTIVDWSTGCSLAIISEQRSQAADASRTDRGKQLAAKIHKGGHPPRFVNRCLQMTDVYRLQMFTDYRLSM